MPKKNITVTPNVQSARTLSVTLDSKGASTGRSACRRSYGLPWHDIVWVGCLPSMQERPSIVCCAETCDGRRRYLRRPSKICATAVARNRWDWHGRSLRLIRTANTADTEPPDNETLLRTASFLTSKLLAVFAAFNRTKNKYQLTSILFHFDSLSNKHRAVAIKPVGQALRNKCHA